jgi:4-hydroxy-3-methylbut-2-enyl diphosphate reductase
VRHEIVHNTYVVNDLKAKGAIFIEDLADVPPGATLVFSAHGVSKACACRGRPRGFQVFDATCPLVTKVHVEVAKLRQGRLRVHHDRPQGPPRGRRHHGPAQRRHLPGGRRGDVARVQARPTSWRW